MTGLENITKQIIGEAEAAAEKARISAASEASTILADARQENQKNAELLRAETEEKAAAIVEHAKSGAALKHRQAMLAAKQELIAEMISDAKNSLLQMDDESYFAMLLKLAVKSAWPSAGSILLNERDLARAPKDLQARLNTALQAVPGAALTLSDETRSIDGGFVLVYGGIEENCSFEAMFYDKREALQDKVQELLFR